MSNDEFGGALELPNIEASVDALASSTVLTAAASGGGSAAPPLNTAEESICDALCGSMLSISGGSLEGVESSVQMDVEHGNGDGKSYSSVPSAPGESLFRGRRRLGLKWSNMNFSLKSKSKRRILQDCWGAVEGGELCAILGPSGSGKTSVLNVIGGRLASSAVMDVSCCVKVAGERINPVTYRHNVAYLMQDDSLMITATPREALLFSAHLRLEASELANIHAAVTETLDILGISECADTLIGGGLLPGISGGQRKRTSVGVELITNPSILILDEPLSGLDSYTAQTVVAVLKRIARSNATVICTIHQPSSQIFQTFDTAIFMKSGRVPYNGPVSELTQWLEGRGFHCPQQFNPADFAMEVLQTNSVQQLEERGMFMDPPPELTPEACREAAIAVVKSEAVLRKSPASVLNEIHWLTLRELRNVVRNVPALKGRFGTSAVTSLIMGMVFLNVGTTSNTDFQDFKSHNGALTMLGMAAMMLSAIPTLMEFPTERNMFMREHSTGTYSAPSYFVSKALLELPVTFMQILMQWLIAFWMIRFDGNFIFFVATCWGIAVAIASLAMLLGALLPDPKEAMEMAPMLFMPQIIFAGFFIPTDRIPVWLRWVQYLCGLKYGINLLLMNEFSAGIDDCQGAAAPICSQLLEDNSVYPKKWYVDVLVLIAIFFGFRTVACAVLSYKSAKFY